MNIQFADKLSSHVWSNMMDQPQHTLELTSWLARFMAGGWRNVRDNDIGIERNRPVFNRQGGTIQTLHIAVSTREVEHHPEAGLITHEFDWAVTSTPVDQYGQPIDSNDWTRLINGGLINHGDFDAPDWSSHT